MPNQSQPPVRWRSRATTRLWLAMMFTLATVLAWPQVHQLRQRWLAEHLAERAVQTPDASAPHVRQMWRLGLPATESLVRLAAVQRPEIAEAAQEALADQLASWEVAFAERGDVAALADELACLSRALGRHAGQFDAAGQFWAKKLARQIVSHAEFLPPEAAWPVLAGCEVVLSAPAASRPTVEAAQQPTAQPRVVAAPPPATVDSPIMPSPVAARAAPLQHSEGSAELSVIMPSTQPLSAAAGRGIRTSAGNPLRPVDELAPAADAVAPSRESSAPGASSAGVDVPSPLDMRREKQRLRAVPDRELIAIVDTAPRFEAAAARQVLRSRGYSDELLRVTREVRELPPAARRQALDRAGTLPAADARRLLRWFVADEDAEVRLQALTMLATTGDPKLAEIARERAVDDADPRVAEFATKLLGTR